ncbi:Ras- protein Rab-11A [Ceratobasidium sp. 428]|nr:Ras- protein Rab-11A [Ceratobasidium sp. 428]
MTSRGELVKATLWDTAGQERFRSLTRSYYNKAQGVFLLYSVANSESFDRCMSWLTEIRANVDERVPIMLVGNQVDRTAERTVSTSQAQRFALQQNLLFIEVSAKYGTNVDYAFRRIIHEILSGLKDRNELDTFKEIKTPRISPSEPPPGRCRC